MQKAVLFSYHTGSFGVGFLNPMQ